MMRDPEKDSDEVRRLRSQAAARERDLREMGQREQRQETLIARLRQDVKVRDEDLSALHVALESAEHELQDLRAIRDALTPPELPERPGLEIAAAFLPAADERVSGDFYLVADGPHDSTVLAVGDVVGHGVEAARRAAFVRTAFVATAAFSDDPARLLSWVNTALIERAGTDGNFVTAACVTYLPSERRLRWAYAGHPPALWLDGGQELIAPRQGVPLGVDADPHCAEGRHEPTSGEGVLLYTDGLTEARHDGRLFGLEAVSDALAGLQRPSAAEAVALLRARVADYAYGSLTDDLCLLATRMA
jgi:sigma-B regulation protein RsbU (phosphoserine phosphatase)